MSKAAKYVKRDQWTKIQTNRKRLADAQEQEEREREAIRRLNSQAAKAS